MPIPIDPDHPCLPLIVIAPVIVKPLISRLYDDTEDTTAIEIRCGNCGTSHNLGDELSLDELAAYLDEHCQEHP